MSYLKTHRKGAKASCSFRTNGAFARDDAVSSHEGRFCTGRRPAGGAPCRKTLSRAAREPRRSRRIGERCVKIFLSRPSGARMKTRR